MTAACEEDVWAGQAVYSARTLKLYDALVLGFSNRFLWRCPTAELLALYDANVSANHLDAGVATGFFLDACRFPVARPRLGQDFFARGEPEKFAYVDNEVLEVSLYELLKAYGAQQSRTEAAMLRIQPSKLYSADQALKRLTTMIGSIPDWANLITFLPENLVEDIVRKSALASTFVAALQLAKEGKLSIRQGHNFGPIFVRASERPKEN